VSRRRKSLPNPKRTKDQRRRRLRRVCTGRGTHDVQLLDEIAVPDTPGRPDLAQTILTTTVRLDAAGVPRLTACPKCNRYGGVLPDEATLHQVLWSIEPGRPLRWDVSTRRLLGGPPVARPVVDLGGNGV